MVVLTLLLPGISLPDLETTLVVATLVGVGFEFLLALIDLNGLISLLQCSGPRTSDIGLFAGDQAEEAEVMD